MARLKRFGTVVVSNNKLEIRRLQGLGYIITPEPVFNPIIEIVTEVIADDQKIYVCSECEKTYKKEGSFKKHMLELHNIEL